MNLSVKQMVEAADAVVPRITPEGAKQMMAGGEALVVDVRDAPEVAREGKIAGAINISRGMLEFRYKYPGKYMFHAHVTEFAELGWTGVIEVTD